MTNSALQRNMVFVAGWVLAGLAIAFAVNPLWREDRGALPAAAPVEAALPSAAPTMVPAHADYTPDAATVAPVAAAAGTGQQDHPPGGFAAAVRSSAPAVVSISTLQKVQDRPRLQQTPRGWQMVIPQGLQEGLGSGVIIDTQGHIVTNSHVVAGVDRIDVQLANGRTAKASVVGMDSYTDLAVLKIDLPQSDLLRLPVMTLSRSDRVEVGDYVLAIGSPFGLSQSVTHGIVSAKGRSTMGVATFEHFIQTDAAINHGNSGGALVNTRGELIGINTAMVEGANGIGLAIPVELVRGVMQEILQRGHVVRGWIGWAVQLYSQEQARAARLPYAGLVVVNLASNSPARLPGGLTIGDKIETIDGQPALTTQDIVYRVATHKPGTTVKITGVRLNGQPFSAEVKVTEQPAAQ